MALTTKTNVKILIGVSDTSLDDVIDLLIPQADAILKGYLQREIEQVTYTEYYCGTGDQRLVLNQSPVQSITSVYEDTGGYFGNGTDAFSASSELVDGTDYVLRKDDDTATEKSKSGILFRIGKSWPRPQTRKYSQLASAPGLAIGNIKVVYVAGWAIVPADIQFAANKLVASMISTRDKTGHIQSENIEDYSYTLVNGETESKSLDSLKSTLAPYKRIVV